MFRILAISSASPCKSKSMVPSIGGTTEEGPVGSLQGQRLRPEHPQGGSGLLSYALPLASRGPPVPRGRAVAGAATCAIVRARGAVHPQGVCVAPHGAGPVRPALPGRPGFWGRCPAVVAHCPAHHVSRGGVWGTRDRPRNVQPTHATTRRGDHRGRWDATACPSRARSASTRGADSRPSGLPARASPRGVCGQDVLRARARTSLADRATTGSVPGPGRGSAPP